MVWCCMTLAKSVCVFGLTPVLILWITCLLTWIFPQCSRSAVTFPGVWLWIRVVVKTKTYVLNAKTARQLFYVILNICGVLLCVFLSDAIQTLQAEVTRLRDRIESCLKNEKPLSSVRAAPTAQENCTHKNTSTPRIRLVCIFQV